MSGYHGRVLQDGMTVAKVTASTHEQMLNELSHYAAVYSLDGPVVLETRAGKMRWRRLVP